MPLISDDDLYLASPATYDAVIRRQPTEVDDVLLIVGHNPGIALFVNALAGQHFSFSPASVAVFELQIERWPDFCLSTSASALLKGYIADGAHVTVTTP